MSTTLDYTLMKGKTMRRTKIVTTLGPATDSPEMIEKLILTGVNVFRLNFSHGSHESHRELFNRIRDVSKKLDRHVAILQDVSGPKIRIGEVDGAIMLEQGDILTFVKEVVKGSDSDRRVCLTYPEILDGLSIGDKIFLADGTIKVQVEQKNDKEVVTRVMVPNKLTSKKGVNFPGVKLPIPSITDKDRVDLKFGAELGVDLIAQSFVRCKADVLETKEILKSVGSTTPVFAKIEMIEAMNNLEEILEAVDGIMVARGDLGVEFGLPKVPVAQKKMIKMANERGLPVITATQMLTSMINSPFPTRAEVSDIANAVLDGTDAVMLSDETAVGHFPIEAVSTLVETITETEKIYHYYSHKLEEHPQKEAIAFSTATLAETLNPDGVITFTTTGLSAYGLAKYRPKCRIIVSSPDERTLRKLCVVWGVEPTLLMPKSENSDELVYDYLKEALDKKIIDDNNTYILTVGAPKSASGSTNLIRVLNKEGIDYILNKFKK